jgi:hypothetical protein
VDVVRRTAAMRILTGTRSALQRGVAEVLSALIRLAAERGTFVPKLAMPTLGHGCSPR